MTEVADLQEQLSVQRQKVDVDDFDTTVRELIRMAAENELHTAPVYQRKFRWDEGKESRLIESLLLNFPIPSIFVRESRWHVGSCGRPPEDLYARSFRRGRPGPLEKSGQGRSPDAIGASRAHLIQRLQI